MKMMSWCKWLDVSFPIIYFNSLVECECRDLNEISAIRPSLCHITNVFRICIDYWDALIFPFLCRIDRSNIHGRQYAKSTPRNAFPIRSYLFLRIVERYTRFLFSRTNVTKWLLRKVRVGLQVWRHWLLGGCSRTNNSIRTDCFFIRFFLLHTM